MIRQWLKRLILWALEEELKTTPQKAQPEESPQKEMEPELKGQVIRWQRRR